MEMWKHYLFQQWQTSMPFFGGNFIKVSLLEEIIEEKFGGIKKISYFCNRVMSERKRTGTMKALVNERIERYLAIEMWKFQSLLTINRQ